MTISPPTHSVFGTAKYISTVFPPTKNQVRGLCVGGDMALLNLTDRMK